ncbi:MAG: hypothetical protein Fur0043_25020 [Anaerolineales bacterium]
MTYVPGIDVSYWEAGIDWKKVRGEGIRFMFAKATEGEGYVDPTFDDNWLGAKSVGILRGAYHFFHPNMNPSRQADRFLQVVKAMNNPAELPPALDLEVSDNQPNQVIIERAKVWLDRVQQGLGKRPIIYSSPGFLKSNFVVPGGGPPLWATEYPLWIAHYRVDQPYLPKGWMKWTFWQYSESGKVRGINAAVDLNWFNGTVDELYRFAGLPLPTATTYVVKQGDTLPGIAEQFGLSLLDLVSANPHLIQPHQTLKIPAAPSSNSDEMHVAPQESESEAHPQPPQARLYTVKAGDTLSGIAVKFDTTYGLIAQLNGIAPPYIIHPGQVLKIP